MGSTKCDRCDDTAVVVLFAAYDEHDPEDGVHPMMRRYPFPQARVCERHIVAHMERDSGLGATGQWLIRNA